MIALLTPNHPGTRAQMKILQSRIWVYFLYAFAFHSGPDAAIWSEPFTNSRQIQGKFD